MSWLMAVAAKIKIGTLLHKLATLVEKIYVAEVALRTSGASFKFVNQGVGGFTVSGDVSNLCVGEGVAFKSNTYIDCNAPVKIGSYCHFGGNLSILTTAHVYDSDCVPYGYEDKHLAVHIEDYVWIGRGAIILPGVRIGRGAIVAAGAVLTRSIATGQIWAGNPAKQIGVRCMETFAKNLSAGRVR